MYLVENEVCLFFRYYQLSTHPAPPVYSMEPSEVKTTLERIAKEMAPDTDDLPLSDIVFKYKVIYY